MGKTAGVVGFSRIGRRLVELCLCLGMDVAVHDLALEITEPRIMALGFHDLLARSNFAICLAAVLPETGRS